MKSTWKPALLFALFAAAVAVHAPISFVLTGWVTIPAGALLGYWLNR
jgi:hypothetical protein